MKIRFRFTKEGEVCYVGHLDMMRFFQKANRRAHIDIAYSQGFNPHQLLSFASPLGLGITSEGEYFDAEIKSCDDTSNLVRALNDTLPEGVRVLSACLLPEEGNFNAMATLTACKYRFIFNEIDCFKNISFEEIWNDFMSQEEITVTKQTKKNVIDIDIKPLIHEYTWNKNEIEVMLSAGSDETIKATSVIDGFLKYAKIDLTGDDAFKTGAVSICRIDQFTTIDGKYVSLGQVGKVL